MCTGGTCCTRWLLMPWLIMYFINICCFISISVILFIFPMPLMAEHAPEFPALRAIGLVPLLIGIILIYFWLVILSLFRKMSSENVEKLKHGGSGSLGGPLLGGKYHLNTNGVNIIIITLWWKLHTLTLFSSQQELQVVILIFLAIHNHKIQTLDVARCNSKLEFK